MWHDRPLSRLADLASDVGHGSERAAGGIRLLDVVAEIEAGMEPLRLGAGVSDRLLFGDDFRVPPGLMRAVPERSSVSEPASQERAAFGSGWGGDTTPRAGCCEVADGYRGGNLLEVGGQEKISGNGLLWKQPVVAVGGNLMALLPLARKRPCMARCRALAARLRHLEDSGTRYLERVSNSDDLQSRPKARRAEPPQRAT